MLAITTRYFCTAKINSSAGSVYENSPHSYEIKVAGYCYLCLISVTLPTE